MCLGFFFFFFQTWPTNKRCQAFVSFVRVVLFSCVSLLAGLLQGPGGRVATGHSSDSEAYSAPPGGRAPSQKCCDCGRAVWTEAPGKLVLPSLCFCAASPSGLEVAAWSCHWHVCYCQTVNGSLNHLWFLQLLPSVTWIIVAVLHTYIYIHICLQPVGRGSDLDCVRHPVR